MLYLTHEPSPPLREAVDFLWFLSDAPAHGRELVVPSGTVELVVNLSEDAFCIDSPSNGRIRRFRGAMVSGCYGGPFGIETRAHESILGVHFRPGGAAGFLGVAPGEIGGAHVELEDLWGGAASELRERLCAATDPTRRFRILEDALLAHVRAAPRRRALATALALLERPGLEVRAVSDALGLSRRRFIEVFTADVGIAPKRYARIRRFQRSLARAIRGPSPSWTRIALDCGYFDHAHLCRDWAELAGCSPGRFLALRRTPVKDGHLALPEQGAIPSKTRPPTGSTLHPDGGRDAPMEP